PFRPFPSSFSSDDPAEIRASRGWRRFDSAEAQSGAKVHRSSFEGFLEGLALQVVSYIQPQSCFASLYWASTSIGSEVELLRLRRGDDGREAPPSAPGGRQDRGPTVRSGSGQGFHRAAHSADQGAASSGLRVLRPG